MDLKSDNPYGHFGPCGPRTSAPGAVRTRCKFLIPKSNKSLNGILFTQGGAPILSADASKTDNWNEADATGESRDEHETGAILMYLKSKEGAGAQDYLLLKDLHIEIVRFSAFVVQRFDKNGTELERHDKPENQPLFIANGDFVTAPDPK